MLIGIDGNEANVKNRVGSGQYAFELLRQFAKSKKHRFLIYLKDRPLSDLPKSSESFQYKVFGPKKFWTQVALPVNLTFGVKPDVFFSLSHYGPRFAKVPYALTIYDLSYIRYPKFFRKKDLYQLTSWTSYSVKNAAHVITISRTTKDDIANYYHINPSKITVAYPGYDQGLFKSQSKSSVVNIKNKYKISNAYIIFVGTLQPRKNLERLIAAIRKIDQNLQLVVVGKKGWMYEGIFKKVKSLGLNQRVIFTDYVQSRDLPVLISGASVYVLPSLWEGFGIPVIEAQACGVPTVVSDTSSLPEVVGKSSILIDPQDIDSIAAGIAKALDKKTKSDLIKKGLANVRRFSWEKCARETIAVLEKIASN